MLRLGLTGGIGSGKSAVEEVLKRHGVKVIDADQVARSVVEPEKPAWRALVDAFGTAVLKPDSTLDREFLAAITFPFPANLRRLNSITHGVIGVSILQWIHENETSHFAVALPLFRPEHRSIFSLDEVWTLEVEPQEAIRRLVTYRSFNREDAEARVAAQISNAERAKISDVVIRNDGSLDDLSSQIRVLLHERGVSG